MFPKASRLLVLLLFAAAAVHGQTPTLAVGGVVNGASFLPANAVGAAVTPGSIAAVFGTNFGPNFAATTLPLPLVVGGTSVTFNGIAAPIFAITPGQINVQVPLAVPTGQAVVQVNTAAGSTQFITVNVQSVAPGIFTTAQNGLGPGAILNVPASNVSALNTFTATALPGQFLSIFGTGFGPATSNPGTGAVGSGQSLTQTPTATVGGLPAQVTFAGLAPGFVGLDQINVIIPLNVAQGCFVPVQLAVDNTVSNMVTVAVSNTGNCSSAATGSTAPPSATFAVATLSQNQILAPLPITTTNFSATFGTAQGLIVTQPGIPPVGAGCTVNTFGSTTPPLPTFTTAPTINFQTLQPLNIGTLILTGTAFPQTTLQPNPFGTFGVQLGAGSPVAGTVTLTNTGGTQLGSFAPITTSVPPVLGAPNFGVMTNVISQGQSLTISFVCPVIDINAQVAVIVRSFNSASGLSGTAQCNAQCISDRVTVPASTLLQLPTSGSGQASIELLFIPSPAQVTNVNGVTLAAVQTTTLPFLTMVP